MKSPVTTLCYLEKDNKYLMLHRVKKENDVNKDKWIGVGGHAEFGESPEDCLLREVYEETGLTLKKWHFHGIVTFVFDTIDFEYMCLYSATEWEGTIKDCNEGTLEWIDKDEIENLNIWEGDKIFFRLMKEEHPFFSLKLVYDKEGLKSVSLDGKRLTAPF